MTKVIKLRKGLDINLKGKPAKELLALEAPATYSLVPDDFTGVTPKVVVKPEEHVLAGDALFVDKNHPEVKFVSPVSGVVTEVERGARRKVMNIVVAADAEQKSKDFGKHDVAKMDAKDIKALLVDAGMFGFFRQRPYDVIANPDDTPRDIFVSAFDSAPLAPDFEFQLQGEMEHFLLGLTALSKICKVQVGINARQQELFSSYAERVDVLKNGENVKFYVFQGPHPAGNVGVQINHIAPVNKGDVVWTVGPEVAIFIGRLLDTGKVDLTRTVAVTGSEVLNPAYVRLKVGANLKNVWTDNLTTDKKLRFISGNVLTGKAVDKEKGYLGAFHSQLTVIPEGDDVNEMLGWIAPRFKQFSTSRSYFSWLRPKKTEYTMDARIKGGERHMIMSGEYDKVFPFDIYPEYLLKAILAGDIDKAEALGIYEVAPEDFALCEFVDSSKVELQRIVREGLDALRAEMS